MPKFRPIAIRPLLPPTLLAALLLGSLAVLRTAASQSLPARANPAQPTLNTAPASAPSRPLEASPANPGMTAPLTTRLPSVLLAADGQFMWLLQRQQLGDQSNIPGFHMLIHPANALADNNRYRWQPVQIGGETQCVGNPAALAITTTGAGPDAGSRGFVFFDDGSLAGFSSTARQHLPSLPGKPTFLAAAGAAPDGVWVLWRGPPQPTPATTPATRSATAPAATAAATAAAPPSDLWQIANFRNGQWKAFPSPGAVSAPDVPSASARPALLAVPGRVCLVWVDAAEPQQLRTRCLDYRSDAKWSDVVISMLPNPVARPVPIAMDAQWLILWVQHAGGNPAARTLEVASVQLTPAGAVDKARPVPPMSLGESSVGLDPELDVSLAREATSLMVVLAAKDGHLAALLFDPNTGKRRGGGLAGEPSPIEPQPAAGHDTVILQNIVLIVMAALLGLSLWQWRRRPMAMRLPPGYKIALIRQRVLGGLIDLAIPACGVVIAYGLYDPARFIPLKDRWLQSFAHPEILIDTPAILTFLAVHVGYLMILELFTGRSIGKALMGLRVVAIDGTTPGAMAIVMRNLVRAPELVYPILLMYMFINDQRQRFGDLAARTLVVRQATPEELDADKKDRPDA